VNLRLISEVRALEHIFSKSSIGNVRRTLIFNVLYVLPIIGNAIGMGLMIAGLDNSRIFVRELLYPSVALGQLFFNCATLNISSIWDSMARKVMPISPTPELSQQKSALLIGACCGQAAHVRHQQCKFSSKRGSNCLVRCIRRTAGVVGVIALSLFALSVAIMSLYFSPFNVSIAMSVGCLVVGVSYAVAGTRMASLLSLGSGALSFEGPRSRPMKGVRIARKKKGHEIGINSGSGDKHHEKKNRQFHKVIYMNSRYRRVKRNQRGRHNSIDGNPGGGQETDDNVVACSTREIFASEISHESKVIWSMNNGDPLASIADVEDNSVDGSEDAHLPERVPRSVINSSLERLRFQLSCICRLLQKRLQTAGDSFDSAQGSYSAAANLLAVAAQIRSMAHFIVWCE